MHICGPRSLPCRTSIPHGGHAAIAIVSDATLVHNASQELAPHKVIPCFGVHPWFAHLHLHATACNQARQLAPGLGRACVALQCIDMFGSSTTNLMATICARTRVGTLERIVDKAHSQQLADSGVLDSRPSACHARHAHVFHMNGLSAAVRHRLYCEQLLSYLTA